jgi:type IV pilus assembly protein PilB
MATRKKLGEVLIEAGLINEFQLNSALNHQKSWGGRVGRILIDNRFITEDQLTNTLSQHLGVPRIELRGRAVAADVLETVPLDMAEQYLIFPVATRKGQKGDELALAMSYPTNL